MSERIEAWAEAYTAEHRGGSNGIVVRVDLVFVREADAAVLLRWLHHQRLPLVITQHEPGDRVDAEVRPRLLIESDEG